jgi:signal transduction histidine kinase/ActR/RegA family two-component response regulator
MKADRKNRELRISAIAAALLVSIIVAAIYIVQLNRTVSGNIIQNISELAEHDQVNIQNNVEETWQNLEYIAGKFASYHCDTLEEIETQMNVECANSAFSHIYMIAEDGKVYTDKYVIYDPDSGGQNGRIDLLPLFENGEERVVERFDDKFAVAGLTKESILYGIRLSDFSVEGIHMVALAGITDISNIKDSLTINSFTKNGISRGYSAVIDMSGNYIVNVDGTVYRNQKDNFFDGIDNSEKTDLTSEEAAAKMAANESFSFYFTNADGVEQIVYCMPFDGDDIPWYFLASVESTVFTEQNRVFLSMSMVMVAAIAVVIIVMLYFVMSTQKKVITANAEAKAQSAFLANMSHEIRTPLNGIIGLIYLLEKDIESGAGKAEVKQKLLKAKETAEYLLSLINNILDISKLQAGKVSVNHEVISPETIMDAVWSMQRNNIENRGVKFLIEKDITVPWIVGDDLAVKQVLMNILSNAAKFTPAGGQIKLSVSQKREDKGRVCTTFTCADTGCGMSQEFLAHIWDSFSQERSSTDQSIKGTGLGMTISRLLVRAMGGEIKVESTLGEGSTFYVILHSEIATEPPEYLQEIKEEPKEEAAKQRVAKILVAEDNELNAEILLEILKSEGFEVVHASNGQLAVDKFRASDEGEFGLILMDMQMPVMDGCTATAEIRKLERADAKKIPIFACTANNFTEDRERAQASGMNDFLSKPIDVKELFKKLEGSLHY